MSKSNAATKKKISELADRLNVVECRLLGIAPILRMVADSSPGEAEAGNSLEAIGGLSDYLSNEVGEIAQLMKEMEAWPQSLDQTASCDGALKFMDQEIN